MDTFKSFASKIYEVNAESFKDIALELFRLQALHNPLYSTFIKSLSIDPVHVSSLEDIPYLPISFFKTHAIKTGSWPTQQLFLSSGTTGVNQSQHHLFDASFYLNHAQKCFEYFFGKVKDYHFLALLPSYLEREGSSLIAMMDHFIKQSNSAYSGFYLYETEKLLSDINALRNDNKRTILWGVSFALLDLAEKHKVDLSHCLIFETGGMKGRRKEITRPELHEILHDKLNAQIIYSEYGMTELLSQAYTSGKYLFNNPPWLHTIGREITDPFNRGLLNETAGINVIDLANWHSISFIETQDIGKIYADGTFEVLGRMDNSDVRGCNLMVE